MGIKSFLGSLFGHSDNQMPSSLGNGKEVSPPLFKQAYSFGNVYVPNDFLKYVAPNHNV
jgi:hypothetical protein